MHRMVGTENKMKIETQLLSLFQFNRRCFFPFSSIHLVGRADAYVL